MTDCRAGVRVNGQALYIYSVFIKPELRHGACAQHTRVGYILNVN